MQIVKVIEEGAKLDEAAKVVAVVLHPHFEKELEYVLPPLCLLSLSKQSKISSEMKTVLTITKRLKADLDLIEHNGIVIALDNLIEVAKKQDTICRFCRKTEDSCQDRRTSLISTAILIGEY